MNIFKMGDLIRKWLFFEKQKNDYFCTTNEIKYVNRHRAWWQGENSSSALNVKDSCIPGSKVQITWIKKNKQAVYEGGCGVMAAKYRGI